MAPLVVSVDGFAAATGPTPPAIPGRDDADDTTTDQNNELDVIDNKYLKPFGLELYNFPETGRGVRTVVDRKPGDLVIQIPIEDTITVSSTIAASAGKKKPNLMTSFLEENGDKTDLSEEQLLALALITLRKDDHRYVSVLPKTHLGVWTMPSTLFQNLCLPRCYQEFFQATRNTVFDFMSNADVSDDKITSNDIQWGFSMVRSRSLAVPELEDDDLALIPGLDMFNHEFDSGTTLQLVLDDNNDSDDNQKYWTLISSKPYKAGDQIFLSYGDEKDDWKLLQTYGFAATPKNPNALIFWTWEDLLDAASQCRPTMFTSRVCKSLLNHPQLTAYASMSEQRAIFSLDGRTGEPRESLQTGLTLMMSLASQLGFPNDENLPNEVLTRLVENRLREIHECSKGQSSRHDETLSSEWKPFWDSIQRVLKQEEAYLKILMKGGGIDSTSDSVKEF